MSNLLEVPGSEYSDNLIWKSWQIAKQRTVNESWKKENSRDHWRAMMDEVKAECAWMIEQNRLDTAETIVQDVMKLVAEILLGKKTAVPTPADDTTP